MCEKNKDYYEDEYGLLFRRYFSDILEYERAIEMQEDHEICLENCFSIY